MNGLHRHFSHWAARALLTVALTMALAPLAAAAGAYDSAAQHAAAWAAGQQQADGSFPGFGVGSTADALIGIAAAARAANTAPAVGYLQTKAAGYVKSPGAAAKLLLALAALGNTSDVHQFGGVDLRKTIDDSYDPASGHYGKDVTGQALVLLALAGRGEPISSAAVTWLAGSQAPDGGWAYDGAAKPGSADTNTTGLALQALAATHAGNDPVVLKALAYLHTQQDADGGFPYQHAAENASDSNSTALVIMGLIAVGQDPQAPAWQQSGQSPLRFLAGMQNPSGALRYQASPADDNAGATYQAVPALAGLALPITPRAQPGTVPEPGPSPGMPTTGAGASVVLPLVALLSAVLLLTGRHLARR